MAKVAAKKTKAVAKRSKARAVEIVTPDKLLVHKRNSTTERPQLTQRMFDEICDRIAEGETLRGICSDERFCSRQGFVKTLYGNGTSTKPKPELIARYEDARHCQGMKFLDDMVDAANGTLPYHNDEFGMERVARDQLRFKVLQYLAVMCAPKLFRQETEEAVLPKLVDAPKVESMQEWVERQKRKG